MHLHLLWNAEEDAPSYDVQEKLLWIFLGKINKG